MRLHVVCALCIRLYLLMQCFYSEGHGPGCLVFRRNENATRYKSRSFKLEALTFHQGSMQNMDLLSDLEIFIPVEAEVKSITLSNLPKSVLKGMGFPVSDCDGARKLSDSPEGVWISPAVLRRKGQKQAADTENSLLGREFRAVAGPFQVSFVSANRTAYKVLKDTVPGKHLPSHTSHASLLPHGTPPQTYKDAVIIHRGQIYLSSRRSNPRRRQRETREPQLASQSSTPSTSVSSSKSLKKRQSPQAALEPADMKVQRKKATLAQTCTEQPKDLHPKADNRSTQELLNDNRPNKKHTTHSETKTAIVHKRSNVSSTTAVRSVPRSTDRGQKVGSTAGGDREKQDLADGEIGSSGSHNIVGIVEHSSSQSWTRREPRGAACASTSLQGEFDFNELAEEEKIAQMKAKLRQSEAAVSNLNSS